MRYSGRRNSLDALKGAPLVVRCHHSCVYTCESQFWAHSFCHPSSGCSFQCDCPSTYFPCQCSKKCHLARLFSALSVQQRVQLKRTVSLVLRKWSVCCWSTLCVFRELSSCQPTIQGMAGCTCSLSLCFLLQSNLVLVCVFLLLVFTISFSFHTILEAVCCREITGLLYHRFLSLFLPFVQLCGWKDLQRRCPWSWPIRCLAK